MKKGMLFMTLFMVSSVIMAQFMPSREEYVYTEAGKEINRGRWMYLVVFDGNKAHIQSMQKTDDWIRNHHTSLTKDLLKTTDGRWKEGDYLYEYNSEYTTNKRITYSHYFPAKSGNMFTGPTPSYYKCMSFSEDKESLIEWYTDYFTAKTYYQRVNLEEYFAPKSQNRDFLYE